MTFTFTMDAFPGYTYFEPTRKVLVAIQVIDESVSNANGDIKPVFPHTKDEGQIAVDGESDEDSVQGIRVLRGSDSTGYGKTANDLMREDVKVKWSGVNATITGTFNKIDNWKELPTENSNEKSGHYFALHLSKDIIGKPFEFIKNGQSSKTEEASEDETFWVLRIDDNKKFTFKSDDKVIANLDFTGATLSDAAG